MGNGAKPSLSPRGEAELAARREREAAALRAHLRRRKDQQRATEVQAEPPAETGETSS